MKKTLIRYFLVFPLLLNFVMTTATAETKVLLINGDVSSWRYIKFNNIPLTDYETVEDAQIGAVLAANSDGGASGYIWKGDIDLDKTQWLHFRWRVDVAAEGFDPRVRSGDDFAFRINIASRYFRQMISLVRSQEDAGVFWESPYSGILNKAYIWVFAGGDTPLGKWQTASINIAELWRDLFADKAKIKFIGLMTDGDNTGSVMKAKYGEIMFSDSSVLPF